MTKYLQSTVLSVIGVIAGVAALSGLYLNFVTPSMQWPILVAAVLLVVIAVLGLVVHERRERFEAADDVHDDVNAFGDVDAHGDINSHGHDHSGHLRVGWLLLVPFMLMGVVTPGPLGAFSAERDSGRTATSMTTTAGFDPLPAGDAVALTLTDYSGRALFDDQVNVEGRVFELTGFASPLPSGSGSESGWALTRMSLACCAGDAQAIKVVVEGAPPPANDQWVVVTGTWKKPPGQVDDPATLPVVVSQSVTQISRPKNPYE